MKLHIPYEQSTSRQLSPKWIQFFSEWTGLWSLGRHRKGNRQVYCSMGPHFKDKVATNSKQLIQDIQLEYPNYIII